MSIRLVPVEPELPAAQCLLVVVPLGYVHLVQVAERDVATVTGLCIGAPSDRNPGNTGAWASATSVAGNQREASPDRVQLIVPPVQSMTSLSLNDAKHAEETKP